MHRFALPILLLLASAAVAQEPVHPDVPLKRVSGVYSIGCVTPADLDLATVCWLRSDLVTPLELGCLPANLPNTEYRLDVTVPSTTFDDAEIRCYVIDDDALVSDTSPNAGIIDFTPPGKGRIK